MTRIKIIIKITKNGLARLTIIYRILCYLALFFAVFSQANEAVANFNQPITIALNKTTYPYQFVDDKGEASGLMIDLWKLWAKRQKVEIKFVPLDWVDTIEQVKQGNIDIHAGLSVSDERKAYLNFSSTLFSLNNYFYLHQKLTNIKKVEQLAPYTIGVVDGSSLQTDLKQKFPYLNIKPYPDREAKYRAALKGEILVFAGIDKLSKTIKNAEAIRQLYPMSKRLLYAQKDYAVAVAKNNLPLLHFIEQGFAKISLEEKAAIERKWLGVDKQSDALLITFSPQVPPYMGLSPTGKPQGLFIDLWRAWSKYTGQKIDFIAEDLGVAASLVRQKNADVMAAFPEGSANNTGLKKAWNLYQAESKVYISTRLPNISNLDQLKNSTIGTFSTSPYREELQQRYPNLTLKYYTSIPDLLSAAENGEIDAMVAATDLMDLRLIQTNLLADFYRLKEPVFISDLFVLVSPENTQLAEMIADGFNHIPADEFIALERKWLPTKQALYFEKRHKMLSLNRQEQQWLKKQSHINIGIVKDWQPMEFINTKGEAKGINIDIFNLIASRTNLPINYVVFDHWQTLYKALLDKKIDMAAGISITPERRKVLNFSKSYWDLPWVIVHPQHLGKKSSFKDFYGKKIAIVKGYRLIDKIVAEFPQISIMLVDTTQEGLIAVQQGVVDGLLEPLVIASELLKKESLIALTVSVIDDLAWDTTYIAIRKDWPALKSIVDKGILSIEKNEKQAIYAKWFNVKINTGFDKNVVLRVALQLGALILIVIIVIIIWNRRLYHEINQRKVLEEKMKHMATHDELTGLGNRVLLKDRLSNLIGLHQRQNLQMAVLFIDLDGFKNVNDTYGHDVGDELLVQLAERLKTSVRNSDTIVRFGGDEFVLLLTGLHEGKEAAFIAEKILNLLKEPFILSVTTTCVSCSIGIALYPEDGTNETDLLKVADSLMYQVKARGKNNYIFNSDLKKSLSLDTEQ